MGDRPIQSYKVRGDYDWKVSGMVNKIKFAILIFVKLTNHRDVYVYVTNQNIDAKIHEIIHS